MTCLWGPIHSTLTHFVAAKQLSTQFALGVRRLPRQEIKQASQFYALLHNTHEEKDEEMK